MKCWAVVPAAGSGSRFGDAERKQYQSLHGVPVLVWTVRRLSAWDGFSGIVVVAPEADLERVRGMLQGAGLPETVTVVSGGRERQDSVHNGLLGLRERPHRAGGDDLVFVHDGARPHAPVERFGELAAAAVPDGALLAMPCRDTLKREEGGRVAATLDRSAFWLAQTPQVFPLALLLEAVETARGQGSQATDEAALVEALGRRPALIRGDPRNLKITVPEDLELAAALDGPRRVATASRLAVGHGYDVHRFAQGRRLVLGGVELPHPRGLLGHSDADVLSHAIADACLGAAGLGDIGRHFPDTDPRWKGVSSLDLLARVARLVEEAGWQIRGVDATVIAERPKIAPFVPTMEGHLSAALGLAGRAVRVKATTTEGLGFEGRQEGISTHAVALLERLD